MTLEVLLKMRPVFEALRGEMAAGDPLLRDLIDKIPNEFQFLIYEELTPVLQIRQESDRLSGDKYPTSPEVCPSLYRIHSKINSAEDRIDTLIGEINDETDEASQSLASVKCCLKELRAQLKKRLPFMGSGLFAFAVAHLLHPFHRGAVLSHQEQMDRIIAKLIMDHPSTAEFEEHERLDDVMNNAYIDNPAPAMDPFETLMAKQEASAIPGQVVEREPPLKLELDLYRKSTKPAADVDILAWWKLNASSYKHLSEMAR
jgi:hypothetical protein